MASISRALRPLRKELNELRSRKIEIPVAFTNNEQREQCLDELQNHLDLLKARKDSFEKVRSQFLSVKWEKEADQKAAEDQSEEDSNLMILVDKVLVDVNSQIRRVTRSQKNQNSNAAPGQNSNSVVTKLPKLTFPTFDGNIQNWQTFWDRFNVTVNQNKTLSKVDKMSFLVGQLTGAAATTISGLAITEANYDKAITTLKDRFGDVQVIIDSHYLALADIQRADKQKNLRLVVDKLELHLNALDALEEDVNHRQIATTIRSKLPPPTLMQLDKEEKDSGTTWDTKTLRNHLCLHLQSYERSYPSVLLQNNDHKSSNSTNQTSNGKRDHFKSSNSTNVLLSSSSNKNHQHHLGKAPTAAPGRPTIRSCPFCDQTGHFPDQCPTVTTSSTRYKKLKEKRLCSNCLGPFHPKPQCPRTKPCFTCKKVKNHHSSLCRDKFPDSNGATATKATNPNATMTLSSPAITTSAPNSATQLLASRATVPLQTATAKFLSADGKTIVQARGIFDNGSQESFISKQLAAQLKLKTEPNGQLSINTFGSKPPREIDYEITTATIQQQNGQTFSFPVGVIPTITGDIQIEPINSSIINEKLKGLQMADQFPIQTESVTLNFLIGTDFMWRFLTGEIQSISENVYLIGTKLGWLIGGRLPKIKPGPNQGTNIQSLLSKAALFANAADGTEHTPDNGSSKQNNVSSSKIDGKSKPIDLTFLWDLETLGIKERLDDPGDEEALQKFNQTVKYEKGRYYVTWPWRDEKIDLPSNYHLALGRLNSLIKRYKSEPQVFEQYQKIIEDQLQKGVIEKIDANSPCVYRQHYIPHQAVITPGRTTKLRVVYDASAKTTVNRKSLNDCLFRGPIMLDNIVPILIRFRLNKIAMAADIEKAFLQVGLQESERDVTRFLWLKDPNTLSTENNIQIYRFARVPFGFTSSPFLLAATIRNHLCKAGSETAKNILENIYVDNILTGVENADQAKLFYTETKQLFSSAAMNVREWISNSNDVWNFIPEADRANGNFKVLGLPWNPKTDKFSFITPTPDNSMEPFTKRTFLQMLASFFDPLGLFSPAWLRGKILLQQLWQEKIGWDDPIPENFAQQAKEISNDLFTISSFTFPRYIGHGSQYELHIFCDASQMAYGIAIYIHFLQNTPDQRKDAPEELQTAPDKDHRTPGQLQLIFAKSRVAPVRKTITIPCLELMAVQMGAQCLKFVSTALPKPPQRQIIWTDSQCVLHWLQSDKPLTVFVRNRIKQIQEIGQNVTFQYIRTDQNPADLASRGLPAKDLVQSSLWWSGPTETLQIAENKPVQTPITSAIPNEGYVASEICQTTLANIASVNAKDIDGIGTIIKCENFSSFTKLLRITAWCRRAITKSKSTSKYLTAQEIERAKTDWIKWIQNYHFSDAFDSIQSKRKHPLVTALSLQVDDNGILRCGGRLHNSKLPDLSIHPILLPKGDHFTALIIQHHHQLLFHAGVSHTLAQIRNQYWIPAGRAAVSKILHACKRCRKYDGPSYKVPMTPPLPVSRVTPSPAFTFTGLDYFGPVSVKLHTTSKEPQKTWVCIFTCLATRAIHLELAQDLSADQFLQCLRRFCSRRGVPSMIYSDNAPQFKLVHGTLDKLWTLAVHAEDVTSYSSTQGIQWRFIIEYAPWMGGYYERLIRTVKQGLRKTLGRICLTTSQFQTILTEIEAAVNSRPLIYVGADFDSGYCLTPGHFLSVNAQTGIPSHPTASETDPDHLQKLSSKEQLLLRWGKGQAHLEQFWTLWSNEYLLSLRERSKNEPKQPGRRGETTPKIGDIVQLQHEGPRGTWRLGKVAAMLPSHDGQIRSIKIRLPSGKIVNRSVMHIYPLECTSSEIEADRIPPPPPIQELPVAPVSQIKRKAAQQASLRIRKIAEQDHDSSDEEPGGSGLLSSIRKPVKASSHHLHHSHNANLARNGTNEIYAIFLLLLLSAFSSAHAFKPLLCQAHEAKMILDLSPSTQCPTVIPDQLGTDIVLGTIHIFKRNIAKYSSTAYRCKKIKTVKSAWTGFAKAGYDHSIKEIEIDVSEQECQLMIKTHRCAEGPLLGSNSVSYTNNDVDYPWTTGNAWDCCQWYHKEIVNCFLTQGRVYETFGGVMESNLGNTAACEYSRKLCVLPDKGLLVWETVKEAQCEFVLWRKTLGKSWNNRFMSNDQEIALTWNPDETADVEVCDKSNAKLTDQGFPVIFIPQRAKRNTPASQEKQIGSDPLAARLQALEERMQESFAHNLNSEFNRICRSIQRMQKIDLILAQAEPTLIARYLLNDTQIMAALNGPLLEVWPCVPILSYSIHAMNSPRCSAWIPINFTIQGKSISGFLDPKTNIIFKNSAPADCKLVEELHLRDEKGELLVYSARTGKIEPFKGTILSHPLYHDNFTDLVQFKEIIHKPLSVYSLDELRAQISFNDLFESMDRTKEILGKLADLSSSKPENEEANKIIDNLARLTPFGYFSQFWSKLLNAWIYFCCAYVTVTILWDRLIGKSIKRWILRLWKAQEPTNLWAEIIKIPSQVGPIDRIVETESSL